MNKEKVSKKTTSLTEEDAALALLLLPGVGTRRFFRLQDTFGSAIGVWKHGSKDVLCNLVPGKVAEDILKGPDLSSVARLKKYAEKAGFWLLFFHDPAYPKHLKHIDSPPPLLFGYGCKEALNHPCVAIVGSRKASTYGRKVCSMIAKGLAANGVTIVSGLALGIDSCAHRTAVENGGVTVAVKGCGIDVGYPVKNISLAKKIGVKGAVITEFFPGVKAEPGNFPRRNRIISGLSLGVIVIEAGLRSGSLITAYLALEQGREVMAVPGSVFSYGSKGCHKLIKEGAYLVESWQDVAEVLNLDFLDGNKVCRSGKELSYGMSPGTELSDEVSVVVDKLKSGPQHIDEIAYACSLPVSKVTSILTELELMDIAVALGSGIYSLK